MKMITKWGCRLLFLALCWMSAASTPGHSEREHRVGSSQIEVNIPNLIDFQLQKIDFQSPAEGVLRTTVSLAGTVYTMTLWPHSLRAEDFKLLVQGPDGQLREVEPPPVRTYRGVVDGLAHSRVAASIIDGEMSAALVLPDDTLWGIQPVRSIQPGAAPEMHFIYRAEDWLPTEEYYCGTDETLLPPPSAPSASAKATTTHVKVTEIAIDADVEFVRNRNIGSAQRAVTDIETVMNTVEAIYERQLDITYEITAIVLRAAEPDPYSSTDAAELLGQVRQEWNHHLRHIRRDVTHLMTGKNLRGNIIGIALLRTICIRSQAYGLSQSVFVSDLIRRACLTAHELGHSWGAVHCDGDADCGIMCSVIGRCSGDCSNFGARAVEAISETRDTRPCLTDLPEPLNPPVFDDFSASTLDPNRWTFNNGARISQSAVNEPSEPNALNLNASGPEPYRDDEVRSNFIHLRGLRQVTISFFTQHRGVEAGERLIVEYWSKNLEWKPIAEIISDGVDQERFTAHSITLERRFTGQPDAFHDEFRIRFRADVDEPDDNWYIDDVRIAGP
ncbi:MAG: hypothetical protein D6723_15440 [Acidobacteria bacterium]|nr:MAG: hypothetical protein D6723_15440 [Acidobacteriota bacterium]